MEKQLALTKTDKIEGQILIEVLINITTNYSLASELQRTVTKGVILATSMEHS